MLTVAGLCNENDAGYDDGVLLIDSRVLLNKPAAGTPLTTISIYEETHLRWCRGRVCGGNDDSTQSSADEQKVAKIKSATISKHLIEEKKPGKAHLT